MKKNNPWTLTAHRLSINEQVTKQRMSSIMNIIIYLFYMIPHQECFKQ